MSYELTLVCACFVLTGTAFAGSGPWDMAALRKAPQIEAVQKSGKLTSLYYECEPYQGKPARVFAYLAYPEHVEGRAPGVVLVHGGGGQAFPNWAQMWAARGYVALAMDLEGHGPEGKPAPDPWPTERCGVTSIRDTWNYHAVAAVIRGVSLLTSLPEVDPKRIGITGISWGGYLTCIVAGLDNRLKAAVPVYGCGFIRESCAWADEFKKLSESQIATWVGNFDPSSYLGQAKMPMLFANGTNDFAYHLDMYQKSYRLVPHRTLCIRTDLLHSHEHGWAPVEIGIFVDHMLKGTPPLASIRSVKRNGASIEMKFRSDVPIARAALNYTTDTCLWRDRKWQTIEAKVSGSTVRAELPPTRPIAYFLTLTDSRNATVSSEHEVVEH